MEIKELKIQIPEGYEIDKDKSTFEKIVFRKKDASKPRSWEEYVAQHRQNTPAYFIDNESTVRICGWYIEDNGCMNLDYWKNVLPTKELAEAFLAMMQLMSLRQEWVGDWKPEWKNDTTKKWGTVFKGCEITVDYFYSTSHPLSFPTKEMAEDFINCFKDLLEVAKLLI